MHDATFPHVRQCDKDLVGVGPRRVEVDADIVSKLLQHFPQVKTQTLKHHAQVAFVVKVAPESDHVLAALGVRLVDLL